MKFIVTDPVKAHLLSIILKNLKLFVETITFRCMDNELHIQTLDQGHCCLLDLHISGEWFDTYDSSFNQSELANAIISINTTTLQKVMDTRANTQSMEFSTDVDADNLYISLTGSQKVCNKKFKIPLLDLETDLMEPTINESNVDLVMPTKSFTTLIKQMQGFSHTLQTHFTDSSISFEANGTEGSMIANVDLENDASEYSISEDMELKQQFGIKYMEYMYAFGGLSPEIIMYFSENQPFHAKYILDKDTDSCLSFYLAPMVDDD